MSVFGPMYRGLDSRRYAKWLEMGREPNVGFSRHGY